MKHEAAVRYAHEMRAGERYAPLRFRVSAELNQQYLFTLADYDADYLGVHGAPARVHPVLLLHMSARTRSPSFRSAPDTGSVFASDDVTFRHPALVDEWLDVDWLVREVYERKGRLYQALDTTITNGSGQVVLKRHAHSLFFTRDGRTLPLPAAG